MARNITPDEALVEHRLLRESPEKYIEKMSAFIGAHPDDSSGYFARAGGWQILRRLDKALEDIDRSLALDEKPITLLTRGELLMELGHYEEALKDFNRAETLDSAQWTDCWGPLYRANCHARLGHEQAALGDCSKLPDGFFSPGLSGTPSGNKKQIIAEIRRRAEAAKRG